MPIQPVRPATPQQPVRRPATAGTDWGVDLPPVGQPIPQPGPAPRPDQPPAPRPDTYDPGPPYYSPFENPYGQHDRRPHWASPVQAPPSQLQNTNETRLNGRNLRYAISGENYVSIPYLSADLIDKTPQDPLDLWAIGSYTFRVSAARIDVDEKQLNGAIAGILAEQKKLPVSKVSVGLLDGNRVKVGLNYKLGPVPLPLSARLQVTATSPDTLNINPESIKVLGLPVGWAVKLFGIDVPKLMKMPPGGPLAKGAKGTLDVDLRKVEMFQGRIAQFGIRNGQAAVVLGGAPDADVSPRRRGNVENYAEVIAKGETALDTGVIRDAKIVIIDNTPQDPYSLNRWDQEGYARLEYGKVVLPEQMLAKKFGSAGGEGFYMDSVKLEGTDLVCKGQKEVLGLPIPVSFKIRFTTTPSGELYLVPHDVHVAGLGFGKSQIIDAMKSMPGMKKVGDGLVLDLRASASLDMPPIKSVTAERGRVVMNT